MAWGNFVLDKGFGAAAALTKFRVVKFSAAEMVTPVTAFTDEMCGVVQFGVTSLEITRGKDASVRLMGVSEVEASTAISASQWCTLENDGRVCALVGASGKKIVGKCVGSPAASAGDRIAMLIVHTNAVA